jgi:hypothetical protein
MIPGKKCVRNEEFLDEKNGSRQTKFTFPAWTGDRRVGGGQEDLLFSSPPSASAGPWGSQFKAVKETVRDHVTLEVNKKEHGDGQQRSGAVGRHDGTRPTVSTKNANGKV